MITSCTDSTLTQARGVDDSVEERQPNEAAVAPRARRRRATQRKIVSLPPFPAPCGRRWSIGLSVVACRSDAGSRARQSASTSCARHVRARGACHRQPRHHGQSAPTAVFASSLPAAVCRWPLRARPPFRFVLLSSSTSSMRVGNWLWLVGCSGHRGGPAFSALQLGLPAYSRRCAQPASPASGNS